MGDLEVDGVVDAAPPVTLCFQRAANLSCVPGSGAAWPWKMIRMDDVN